MSRKPWFKANGGLSWGAPCSIEGWLALICFFSVALVAAVVCFIVYPEQDLSRVYYAIAFGASTVFIIVANLTKERPGQNNPTPNR
jgi:hypothetical protein